MKRLNILIIGFLLLSFSLTAQKQIRLEDIWKDYLFYPNSISIFNFLNDGQHYASQEINRIVKYDLLSEELASVIFNARDYKGVSGFNGSISDYSFSEDESKILLKSESEQIFRHSTRANFFIFDNKDNSLQTLFEDGKHRYATFNPQGDKVAFVYKNNLYYKDLSTQRTVKISKDGEINKIINGATDWVYEEEFSFSVGFQWSPDGQRIAFYRFDESQVREFTITNYHGDVYPEYQTFNYPKVGEKNAEVTIHIFDLNTNKIIEVASQLNQDYYIPRIKWTMDPEKLCVFRMNRHQNKLELLLANVKSGKTKLLLKEENKYYIDIHDNLTFLKDGKHFIWTSEQSGWNHIYLYNMKGKKLRPITSGKWEVSNFYGVDEDRQLVYYQAAEKSPLERQVYSMSMDGKRKAKLANKKGWNSAQFSSTFDYYVITHSTANSPPTYVVFDDQGRELRIIEDNSRVAKRQRTFATSKVEFFDFETTEGIKLNGWMIKPPKFFNNRKYPLFMYVYGEPGSQTVEDRWMGHNYWWFQMLAQQGFVVASVDNRGTGGRGEHFKKMTYLQLGKYETIDQIQAAKYLGSLSYTDPKRIGIFGWSYGGYMSSLAILKGADVFKAAIAVAPITNWKWYDTIYTERYMRTEKENQEGYYDNSPVNFAGQLRGDFLLLQGMGDDNVHLQNAVELTNALILYNKQFETFYYPNRNHSIYGGGTRLHLYTKMTNFLKESLKTAKASRPALLKKKAPIADPIRQ